MTYLFVAHAPGRDLVVTLAEQDGELLAQILVGEPACDENALLDKLRTEVNRRWYAAKAMENNWSRNGCAATWWWS